MHLHQKIWFILTMLHFKVKHFPFISVEEYMCHLSNMKWHNTYYNAILLQVERKSNIEYYYQICYRASSKIIHFISIDNDSLKITRFKAEFYIISLSENIVIYNWSAAKPVFSGYAWEVFVVNTKKKPDRGTCCNQL